MPGGPAADRAVAEWSAMGVDTVRIFALWSQIAPAQRPSGFRPADPNDGHYQWFYLDNAVDRVRAAGMNVTLTVDRPGARVDEQRARPPAGTVEAAAVRLRRLRRRRSRSGTRSRVDRYILWNEPNISIWLSPQARCRRGPLHAGRAAPLPRARPRRLPGDRRQRPRGRDRDRRAVAARPAPAQREHRDAPAAVPAPARLPHRRLAAHDHRRVPRLQAGDRRRLRDPPLQRPHGARAAGTRTPTTSAWRRSAPCRPRSTGSSAPRRSGPPARRFPIFIDEYGYQTSPPDRISGIKPQTQDAWLQRAAYLAWRTPRIKLFTQYLWRDEPRSANGTFSGWQSGLRFTGGRAKPSLAHFDTPFALDARNRRLWGQVRPGGAHTVTVERKPKGGAWTTLAVTRTNGRGYWALRRPLAQPAPTATEPTAGRVRHCAREARRDHRARRQSATASSKPQRAGPRSRRRRRPRAACCRGCRRPPCAAAAAPGRRSAATRRPRRGRWPSAA